MTTGPASPTTTTSEGGRGLRVTSWDVGYLASVLVVLAGSLVPLITVRWGVNLWGVYNLFFLGIGILLPLAAAGFLIARAASGTSVRDVREAGPRLGSLSTEQFAHVAAWLALAFYFITFATTLDPVLLIGLAGGLGLVVTSPLRGLVAPLVTGTAGSAGTAGSPAHTSSHTPSHTPVQSPTPAPAPRAGEVQDPSGAPADTWEAASDAPVARGAGTGVDAEGEDTAGGAGREDGAGSESEYFPSPSYGWTTAPESPEEFWASPEAGGQGEGAATGQSTGRPAEQRPDERTDQRTGAEIDEDLGMTRVRPRSTDQSAASADATVTSGAAVSEQAAPRGTEPAEYEAFWFAVGSRRSAVDAEDAPLFDLEPGGWILALEDRGQEYLVQNTDGRTGLLRDLTDIERA